MSNCDADLATPVVAPTAQPLPDQLVVEDDNADDVEAELAPTRLHGEYLQPFTLRKHLRELLVSKDAMKKSFRELHTEIGRAFEDDDDEAFNDWYQGWKELREVLDQRADLSKEVRHLQARCSVRRAKYKNVVELFNHLAMENRQLRRNVAELEEQLSVRNSVLDNEDERPVVNTQLSALELWKKLDAVCEELGQVVEPFDEPRGSAA